jgi:anti-sigma B factor antagonist
MTAKLISQNERALFFMASGLSVSSGDACRHASSLRGTASNWLYPTQDVLPHSSAEVFPVGREHPAIGEPHLKGALPTATLGQWSSGEVISLACDDFCCPEPRIVSEVLSYYQDDVLIVRFKSATFLDDVFIIHVGRELLALADQTRGKLLLDFQGVTFMSSAMIGKVVVLSKKCRAEGIEFRMCNVPSCITDVLDKRRLSTVFMMSDSVEDALLEFGE